MRVLATEDDAAVRCGLVRMLRRHGFVPVEAATGEEALGVLARTPVDMLITDWFLTGMSGIELVTVLRRGGNAIPAIVMTGQLGREACGRAFAAGADDFVTKPLGLELMARVRRLADRDGPGASRATGARPLVLGRLRVDAPKRSVAVRSPSNEWQPVALTRTETGVVLALAERSGSAVSRDAILDKAWGQHHPGSAHAVAAVVSKIRKKLGPARGMLSTVRGGYRLGPARGIERISRCRDR